jgi:2-oxo-hept-3-ene-1,7-dioate hydratase
MTMLSQAEILALANELDQAEKSRRQISQFSARFPGMTMQDGYRISREWVRLKLAAGRRVIGHKIGLTSRAMQLSSQIDEPDFGTLLDDMLYQCPQQGQLSLPIDRFIKPRVEVELAFVLRERLSGTDVTEADVIRATEYVCPAIEIIDARIEQFDAKTGAPRKVYDTISDNAANAAIVLGAKSAAVKDIDLRWCGSILSKNGTVEETGLAAGVLGNPVRGVVWLAHRLAPWGEALEPGQIVLAGSFTRPVAALKGDVFEADYGPLGLLNFKFD